MNEGITRVCRKCGVEKPLEEFHRAKAYLSGHVFRCKECVKKYHHEQYLSKLTEIQKKYRNEPKYCICGGTISWRDKTGLCRKCYMAKWRTANRTRERGYNQKYAKRRGNAHREWVIKNKERVHNCHREWRKKNIERVREWQRKERRKLTENLSDTYVRGLIVRSGILSRRDVPIEIVEIKRAQIKLKRLLNNHQ